MNVIGHASNRQTRDEPRGILLILISALLFSLMSLFVRGLAAELHSASMVWYRSLLQMLALSIWTRSYFAGGAAAPPLGLQVLGKIRIHFFRGAFGILSMYSLYFALHELPMALANLLAMSSVFWAALCARVFLGERWTRRQVGFGILMCLGVACSLWPSGREDAWVLSFKGVAAALLSGLFMGLAQTVLRRMRQTYGAREIVFFFGWTGFLLTTPVFLSNPEAPASLASAAALVALSALAIGGQFLLTSGFRTTRTLTASLCQFQGTLLTAVWGAVFLAELPPRAFFLGVVLVLVGIWGLVGGKRG